MNVTLDGFLSGPGCELDWHFNTWSTEMAEALCDQLEKADTLLFGRVTYLAMATYWTSRAMDYSCPTEDRAYVDMMNRYKKIVFSNTLAATHWNNSVIATNPVIEEVPLIKQQEGGSIMVYGSGRLVSSLIKHNLADEFPPVAAPGNYWLRQAFVYQYTKALQAGEHTNFSFGGGIAYI
jgi:dihydrofolate reductase